MRTRLLETADLERSLSSDHGPLDEGLALWAIETVSATALQITGQNWVHPDDVPPAALAVIGLATRRLYTNPDRFTREAEGDYSYGLDATVTKADIFTPAEMRTLADFRTHKRPQGLGVIHTRRGDGYGLSTGYVPDGTRYGFPWYAEG
ncbi:hypothetical protein GP475_08785 [Corynebacterium poyangense]|uniref:Phage gp6-like head-tail connector protein n=1 Tax=Corynebacterium poyangense TaxID=2684405 RepID=A0A7H0SQ97_9CORY|nr:hypothetical protein [Corynebacterium poyangense]QNQ90722.1 hypothetical protein GP475_08785 [Corynebacterium poyangense]